MFTDCRLLCAVDNNSFDGPTWGSSSSGAQRATCLKALASAIEEDNQVKKPASTRKVLVVVFFF